MPALLHYTYLSANLHVEGVKEHWAAFHHIIHLIYSFALTSRVIFSLGLGFSHWVRRPQTPQHWK